MVLFANTRDILITDQKENINFTHGNNGYSYLLHETLHALGLSHPFANNGGGKSGGEHPDFDKDATSLSYNQGLIKRYGIGPFDVAVLHFLYGTPKSTGAAIDIFDGGKLHRFGTLFAPSGIAQVDFSSTTVGGDMTIDMAATDFHKQINGVLYLSPSETFFTNTRLALGTQVRDVITNTDTAVKLKLKGNALPNILQGGKYADTLTAIGGNDTLTGRGGIDTFLFNAQSGRSNIVTDFNPKEDWIRVEESIAKIEMHAHDAYPVGQEDTKAGLELLFRDAHNTVVSSVFIVSADLKHITNNLRMAGKDTMPEIASPALPVSGSGVVTRSGH